MSKALSPPEPKDLSILSGIVRDYPGLLAGTAALISRIGSEQDRLPQLASEIRAYALRHFSLHDQHENGIGAMELMARLFMQVLTAPEDSDRFHREALDGILFYLETILRDGRRDPVEYSPLLRAAFRGLAGLPDPVFRLLPANPHNLKRIGRLIEEKGLIPQLAGDFVILYDRYLTWTYDAWLSRPDLPALLSGKVRGNDMAALNTLLFPVSHANITGLRARLKALEETVAEEAFPLLLSLPSPQQLATYCEELADLMPAEESGFTRSAYLVIVLETDILSPIHESAIRQLARVIVSTIRIDDLSGPSGLRDRLGDPIQALRVHFDRHPDAVLAAVQSIGIALYQKGSSSLVEWFLQQIIAFGFQRPGVRGITGDFQLAANKAHLRNIRAWLSLIGESPKWSKSLISALLVNLSLGGVHVADTDIFQRDITRLLDSDIRPVYHQAKELARIFPAYFSVINAEGELRDVSTELDNLTRTADPLVHFLRKHSHVESSSVIVELFEAAIEFWRSGDKAGLAPFLPPEILDQVRPDGPFFDDLHRLFVLLLERRGRDLLTLTVPAVLDDVAADGATETEKKRFSLIIRFYQLLCQKYRLGPIDIASHLRQAVSQGLPEAEDLIEAIESAPMPDRISAIIGYLEQLKEIILSHEKYEAVEDIAHKRHIAAGMPSMFGRYSEKKFNALALSFRLEGLVNSLFDDLVASSTPAYITRAGLFQIDKYAGLFSRALRLDGITSNRMETILELLSGSLDVKRFSFSQYLDIFRGFAEAVHDIVMTFYTDTHKASLKTVIPRMSARDFVPKYHSTVEGEGAADRITEQFLRDLVASSLGLQQLDTFISRILKTLVAQGEGLDRVKLDLLMSYDPKHALSSIHEPNPATRDRIHLGNKGFNLVRLAGLGIPVPPGFIITTEVFRCHDAIEGFSHARQHLMESIRLELGRLEVNTGRLFGSAERPLLLSVRSGGAISMPGMMSSLLDVGMNADIAEALGNETGKAWFAWDSYRRFLQSWGMAFGMERDTFDSIIDTFKRRYKASVKILFSPEQMREVAVSYRQEIIKHGIGVVDDPERQLHVAIERVFASWSARKARDYREILGLSEHWGTAVVVQQMIFGNLDTDAGTGVLFSRNPRDAGDRVMLWGDFTTGAQGEDIVSGLVLTLPVSAEQRDIEERRGHLTLEERFPEVYRRLLSYIRHLIYEQRWSAQEVEFTFEGPDPERLYVLQTRDMSITRRERFTAFMPLPALAASYLAAGIGAGGGALSGRIAFDIDDITEFRREDPATPVILVRADTVPDDIRQISAADGLLTARGGSTSHAAIIAARLGKTCVVGCGGLTVLEQEKRCRLNRKTFRPGDLIGIDGRSGAVYQGAHEAREVTLPG